MKCDVVTDLATCKDLWQRFAPKNKIWDEWDVAVSFYTPAQYELHFLKFSQNDEVVGIVPLYRYRNKTYYFFGEGFPEQRRFWFNLDFFTDVFEQFPTPLKIFDMDGDHVQELLQNTNSNLFQKKLPRILEMFMTTLFA